jgi:CheY-like chemotaxis protein
MLSSTIEQNGVANKSRHVLYVDDMRELREVAHLALSSVGHRVECVADGAEAFDRIVSASGAYDLIISDHHMARLNGIGLVIKLREIGYPGKIAIVSSELNREVADEYHQLGVSRILYKPVELADLRSLVLED